jgi:iron complex transport system substrate-binding protein
VRLVSLLPSATEIVYALGLGDDLAGVTFECDEPPAARADKTIVVGGLDTSAMTPGDIDRYVRSRLAAGQDLYTLHARALAALAPDLILTQDLCRVCALPSGHVNEALDYLGCHADVLTLDPHSLAEVLDSIVAVGQRAGVPERAAVLVAGLHERLAAVAARVAGLGRPRVAVVEWVDPPFTAGHWVPDLVTAAGGQPVAARPGMPSVETTWADIRAAEPELVVVAPCGYHLAGAAEQALRVARALPGVPVWAIDADGIVVRPGPRLVNGVEALAAVIHSQAGPAAPPGTVQRVRLRDEDQALGCDPSDGDSGDRTGLKVDRAQGVGRVAGGRAGGRGAVGVARGHRGVYGARREQPRDDIDRVGRGVRGVQRTAGRGRPGDVVDRVSDLQDLQVLATGIGEDQFLVALGVQHEVPGVVRRA